MRAVFVGWFDSFVYLSVLFICWLGGCCLLVGFIVCSSLAKLLVQVNRIDGGGLEVPMMVAPSLKTPWVASRPAWFSHR